MSKANITATFPTLKAVYGRAGASDTDRAAWLAERRQGITATEVRDLATGKISLQRLIDMKLGRIAEPGDLGHVGVVGWGNARERVLAESLRGEGFLPESRVFHHHANPRHLASPDGLQETWDGDLWVSEIKTAAHDLPPGSPELAVKGYELQMQWVMYVIGATRCRFVVEERVEVEKGVFVPGEVHRHWVERDDDEIRRLIGLADDFLAELGRQREEGAPLVDEVVDTHAFNYLRGLEAEKQGRELKESSYAALLAAAKSQQSALHRVTYTPAKPGAVTSVPETDFEKAKRARGGKALFQALQAAQDKVRDAQAAWDAHCERFTTQREVTGKGSGPRVTVTRVKTKEVEA